MRLFSIFSFLLIVSALPMRAQVLSDNVIENSANSVVALADSATPLPVEVDVMWPDSVDADSLSFLAWLDNIIIDTNPRYTTAMLSMPLVFDKQETFRYETIKLPDSDSLGRATTFRLPDFVAERNGWLSRAERTSYRVRAARNYVIVHRPDLVKYNRETLPKAPKEYVIVNDPSKQTITIVEKAVIPQKEMQKAPVKIKRWKTLFSSNIQFSQVYVSPNWYQGGNSSLNLLSDQLFTFSYNDPTGKLLFENLVQWKFNLTTSPEDTVHTVRVSEDLFQINSKFGYKAFEKWYYSASMLFKTQLLTNYAPNSTVKEAEFFSPGELNVGVGMAYSFSYEKPVKLAHTLSISPLSYNLRFVALTDIDPSKFGIEAGRVRNEIGSSVDYTLTWDLRYNIKWMSHLYAFTNYKNVLVEWTNSLDFAFSTYFSARLYLDMRFDNSVAPHPTFGYLQIKELLSIGFSYKI